MMGKDKIVPKDKAVPKRVLKENWESPDPELPKGHIYISFDSKFSIVTGLQRGMAQRLSVIENIINHEIIFVFPDSDL